MLLLLATPVFAENFYNKQSLDINMQTQITFQITGDNKQLNYLTAKLNSHPQETFQQKITNTLNSPQRNEQEDPWQFEWTNINQDVTLTTNTNFHITNAIKGVKTKIPYPLINVPSEYEKYMVPAEIIDSNNPQVIQKASQLAQGEDDLFIITYKIAEWVKTNIEYDLSTLTVEASQKASWVIENKKGVCDELTVIFIAMLRSLGIPARFVTGVSYTTSPLFEENWVNHGWAEVYFPNHGWVPFDVTFGEYGFVDPTHIKLDDAIDAGENSLIYEWEGYGAKVKATPQKTITTIISTGEDATPPITIQTEPIYESVNIGSYNLITTTITNKEDYYYATEIYFSKPEEITTTTIVQQVLLLPGETKKIRWLVKVDEDLSERYIYTFPLVVYSATNVSSKTNFTTSKEEKKYPKSEFIDLLQENEGKVYTSNLILDCEAESKVNLDEKLEAECTIFNRGNKILESVRVCAQNNCQEVSLNLNQQKNVILSLETNTVGTQNALVEATHTDTSTKQTIVYDVLDVPNIDITNVIYPQTINFSQNFSISFTLEKTSYADPLDAEISMTRNGNSDFWHIPKLEKDQTLRVNFQPKKLQKIENEFLIEAKWKDKDKKEYTENIKFTIVVENATFGDRVKMFFNYITNLIAGIVS